MEDKYETLIKNFKIIKNENEKLKSEITDIKQEKLNKYLIIHGIVEENAEDTKQIISEFINNNLVKIEDKAIIQAERIGKTTAKQPIRPILIKFNNNANKVKVIINKKKVIEKKIYIYKKILFQKEKQSTTNVGN